MLYLALMVIVATIGIGSLIWQQRRQQAHMESVAGFNQALKAISPESAPGPFREARRPARRRPRTNVGSTGRRPSPLDPHQRERARRRVEQRRRLEAQRTGSVRVADARRES